MVRNIYYPYFKIILFIISELYGTTEKYDIVISSGSFAPGHLYSDAFEDIIRMTKPGIVSARAALIVCNLQKPIINLCYLLSTRRNYYLECALRLRVNFTKVCQF